MKTISTVQAFFAALFIMTAVLNKPMSASQRTHAVLYNNQVIPAVELRELEVSAPRKAVLCSVKNINGELVPSVEMKEVTISASGGYIPAEMGIVEQKVSGIRADVVAYQGKLIPQVTGPVVTIESDRYPAEALLGTQEDAAQGDGFLRVSVRQTFDRIGGFLFDEGKRLIRKMIPSHF